MRSPFAATMLDSLQYPGEAKGQAQAQAQAQAQGQGQGRVR